MNYRFIFSWLGIANTMIMEEMNMLSYGVTIPNTKLKILPNICLRMEFGMLIPFPFPIHSLPLVSSHYMNKHSRDTRFLNAIVSCIDYYVRVRKLAPLT